MTNSAFLTPTFDIAKREYYDAWNNPLNTPFELPPVNVNKVLKDRYRVTPDGLASCSPEAPIMGELA